MKVWKNERGKSERGKRKEWKSKDFFQKALAYEKTIAREGGILMPHWKNERYF